jgi:hypothetical protein
LWAWEEEMLGECQTLLFPFIVQAGSPNVWPGPSPSIWRPRTNSTKRPFEDKRKLIVFIKTKYTIFFLKESSFI